MRAVASLCLCAGIALAGCSLNKSSSSSGPDLVIDHPVQMSTSSSVHLYFAIGNAGNSAASDVSYSVTRDDGKSVKTGTIASLATGAQSPQDASDDASGVGHTYAIMVDPGNAIHETHEDNNETTITSVEGSTSGSGPLQFIDAHYHGAFYYQDPMFHFFVVNTTSADISNVTFTIRQDGTDLAGYPKTISVIHPGAQNAAELFETPFQIAGNATPSGHHIYTVVIDPAGTYSSTVSNRSEINVPTTYGYWPVTSDSKVELEYQDPHYHGPKDDGHTIVFHGWFKNVHPDKSIPAGWHFVIKRNGVPVTLPTPQAGVNIGYTLANSTTGSGPALAPDQIGEYVVRIHEDESVGSIPYSIDIDSDNQIDEQFESSSTNSWENNNHVNFLVVMDPIGVGG